MRRMRAPGIGLVVAVIAMNGMTAAWAQGLIIDRRPAIPVARSFEIREVTIHGKVRDQVAEVQVSQTFHNPGSTVMESEFLFPISGKIAGRRIERRLRC